MPDLVFYFINERGDLWGWKVQQKDGRLVARADRSFRYYLDALADARAHGHGEAATFAKFNDSQCGGREL